MTTHSGEARAVARQYRLADRLGLPDLRGNGRFVAANAIDSLGNGLMMSFPVIFFARTTTLSLVYVGAALTLGRILAMPAPALVGTMIDRYGPRRVVVCGNLISALGYVLYLLCRSEWSIVLAVVVVQCGASAYWTSSRSLVVLAAKDGERTRWFAFTRALRNVGAGAGAAGGAMAVSIGSTTGLRAVVVANAVSFVLAAWLIGSWRPTGVSTPGVQGSAAGGATPGAPRRRGGYLSVLRDLAYLRLVAANLAFVLAGLVPSVLLAVYVTQTLKTGTWLVGLLVVINTALVAVVQTPAGRWTERYRASRVVITATLLNAVAFLGFALLASLPTWTVPAAAVVAMLAFTAGEILGSPPISELSVDMAREEFQGRYQAVFQLAWTLGGAAAPLLFTTLLSAGPSFPWLFLAAASVLAVPAVAGLGRRP